MEQGSIWNSLSDKLPWLLNTTEQHWAGLIKEQQIPSVLFTCFSTVLKPSSWGKEKSSWMGMEGGIFYCICRRNMKKKNKADRGWCLDISIQSLLFQSHGVQTMPMAEDAAGQNQGAMSDDSVYLAMVEQIQHLYKTTEVLWMCRHGVKFISKFTTVAVI